MAGSRDMIGRARSGLARHWRHTRSALGPAFLPEVVAGLVASLVTLTNCLSFAALIFAGSLRDGLPYGLWAFMIGAAVGCVAIALVSSLPPAMAGPRNPPLAVASVAASGLGASVLHQGGDAPTAIAHVLVALSLATLATGLLMWGLGRWRLAASLRFVPYPVIGGFLAASGWFLVIGGLNVALGRKLVLADLTGGLASTDLWHLAVAVGFVVLVSLLRLVNRSGAMLPAAFIVMALVLDAALLSRGLTQGWFAETSGGSGPWSPLSASMLARVDWHLLGRAYVEIATVAAVAVAALLLDVSALEAQRGQIADIDDEFRRSGAINVALAPMGGALVGLAPNASRLLDQLGARGATAGVTAGLFIGAIALSGLDISGLIPTPLLGGLLLFLGIGVLMDALVPAPGQGSKTDLALALAIAAAIVQVGYLSGIVIGLVAATLSFAIRYSRIGAIRRHATRQTLAAPVERAPQIAALLSREGERIHVFWLTGFIFFGTSNGVLEDIRAVVGAGGRPGRRWIVLDMSGVTGFDSSAMLSFRKLAVWARASDVRLLYASLSADTRRRLSAAGLLTSSAGAASEFASRAQAIEQAEGELIAEAGLAPAVDDERQFLDWLERELGREPATRLVQGYLSRRELAADATICRQGEIADTIDFVATGSVVVSFAVAGGVERPIRRMTGSTVIGEMGFIRGTDRTASVTAERPSRLYTLTRQRYDEMRRSDPALAALLLEFFVRQLADRLEFANKEVAALS